MDKRRYGWIRDLPDPRDFTFVPHAAKPVPLPPSVDLRKGMPVVVDQGSLGSCTSCALAGAIEFDQAKQKLSVFPPSRLFIYYNGRVLSQTQTFDAGLSIRDGAKAIFTKGACSETEWAYNTAKVDTAPPESCYTDGAKHKVVEYALVPQNLDLMQQCLASGYPFVVGISIFTSFESSQVYSTGIVPIPSATDSFLGGHALVCCGYDSKAKTFLMRNSWGYFWGMKGYCTLPFDYLTNPGLASDFWKITLTK